MADKDKPAYPDISPRLQSVLQQIADDVVGRLGCVGALVATLEQGLLLPLRAYTLDVPKGVIGQFEGVAGLSLKNSYAVVSLDERKHRDNLCVKAVKMIHDSPTKYLKSNILHDVLRPFVSKTVADMIQHELGIVEVIAVPFTVEREVVGNLFAAKKRAFSEQDVDFLVAFGNQAATAIQSQRDLTAMEALQQVILSLQSGMTDETQVLQTIVDAVTFQLGFAAALVATLEAGNTLPARAFAVDFARSILDQLERRAGLSLTGPSSVVYLDDPRFQDNLSVRALKGNGGVPEKYIISDQLHDLIRPFVGGTFAGLAQRLTGIRKVIAVPFYLDGEVVGNLFAATRKPNFTQYEINWLIAFGQQAAVGLRNARLYRLTEEQKVIAQKFGRMAFSATASVHGLRNHVGVVRSYMHLLQMLPDATPEQQATLLNRVPQVLKRLNKIASILDSLHEPWRNTIDSAIDINDSIVRALHEVFPKTPITRDGALVETENGIILYLSLTPQLPAIFTDADMLGEAFRIMFKNAVEALLGDENGGMALWITTKKGRGQMLEVTIRDSGQGIKAEHLVRIFDLGWSTKEGKGMGFGLFWTKDYLTGLGGTINVRSVWGEGTTFILEIPHQ